MTVKVLGAGSVRGDSIGILGDPFSELSNGSGADPAAEMTAFMAEEAEETDELELLEFLAADLDPVPADPAFRRQLSELLWDLVRDGRAARTRDH